MTAMPPPPPAIARAVRHKVPAVAALIPLAGALAVTGIFTPWFKPTGEFRGRTVLEAKDALYSWQDGKIGLLAPILLGVAGLGVLGLMTGRSVARYAGHTKGPVIAASKSALVAGTVSAIALAVAWFLVPGQFDRVPAEAGGSWDGAERLGIEMSHSPQLGFWCTAAAAGVALLGGLLVQIMYQPPATRPEPGYGPPPGAGAYPAYGAPSPYPAPTYGPPAPTYGPPGSGAPTAPGQDWQPLVYTPPERATAPGQDWQPLVYTPPERAAQPPQ